MLKLDLRAGLFGFLLLATCAFSLTACGGDAKPKECAAISESKGQTITKSSIMRFLRYAGKTRSPIIGDRGPVDPVKLEQVNNSDLIYDGRLHDDNNTYKFHLRWASNATFTGTLAPNCAVTTNWSIK